METTTNKVTVQIEVPVNEEWIDYATQSSDLFRTDHCGYWMYGMDHDKDLGWLCYVHDEAIRLDDVYDMPEYDAILARWKSGESLPEGWHRLDKDAAIRAYVEGVKKGGAFWYEDGDAITYDVAIQKALLGEVVYG